MVIIHIDADDEFQGNIESKSTNGSIIKDFFNKMEYDGATFGNHEFDFGRDYLIARINSANFPYLASNIYDPVSQSQKLNKKKKHIKYLK